MEKCHYLTLLENAFPIRYKTSRESVSHRQYKALHWCPYLCQVTDDNMLTAGALSGSLGQLSLSSFRGSKSSTILLVGVKAGRIHLCRVAGKTV